MSSVAGSVGAQSQAQFLGHPRGLSTLFFTEMWERFSYYGMRALLVLFMVDQIEQGGLAFSDQTATAIYGLYTAAVYLVALPGGWIADRLTGAQRAVWLGGIVIMSGHFVLAIPGLGTFFLGLVLVVLGTGLLKPNISAIVGELYGRGDERRDAGFTIFYMGINIGAALGPLVCGLLARDNWHYGFAAAGVGMLVGLIQFRASRAYLGSAGLEPEHAASEGGMRRNAWVGIALSLSVIGGLLLAGLTGVVRFDAVLLARGTTYVIAAVGLLYFAYLFLLGGLTPEERGRVVVILALFLAAAMFWAGFEQAGSSLNLFAERYTIREFGAFEIPAAWFQSLNPIFIIVLAPLYSMLWVSLARRHLNPAAPLKFAAGLMILGAGFAVMIGAARLVAAGDQVLPTWLFFTYLLHTMGELALSPVGLSSVSRLAPRRFVGQMMGVWFLAASLGNIIAGLIAGEFRADAVEEMPGLYLQIVLTTVGSGVLLALCAKPLKRMMGDAR
ncbi:MAG: peptide MFS transporter [Gammaproteobacteria bacterium]|nr:peptide MFS transporter [Gammaproteobacteria bacterium]MDH3505497.1 peptide MFS transporter [Gammaproteobacteria bacterium]